MEDQKIERQIPWLSLVIISILILILFKLYAMDEEIKTTSLNVEYAYTAARAARNNSEEAAQNAGEARDSAQEATSYAENCPGNY